jgi:hypothetical protein
MVVMVMVLVMAVLLFLSDYYGNYKYNVWGNYRAGYTTRS